MIRPHPHRGCSIVGFVGRRCPGEPNKAVSGLRTLCLSDCWLLHDSVAIGEGRTSWAPQSSYRLPLRLVRFPVIVNGAAINRHHLKPSSFICGTVPTAYNSTVRAILYCWVKVSLASQILRGLWLRRSHDLGIGIGVGLHSSVMLGADGERGLGERKKRRLHCYRCERSWKEGILQ